MAAVLAKKSRLQAKDASKKDMARLQKLKAKATEQAVETSEQAVQVSQVVDTARPM